MDDNTLKRLEYFSEIGKFLDLISKDSAQEDEFYKAKMALINFTIEINKLTLPIETKQGIDSFIKYMDLKVNKRMAQSNGAFFQV